MVFAQDVMELEEFKFINQTNLQQMKRILLSAFFMLSLSVYAQTVNTHVVGRGETIETVAQKYGISVADLQKANPDTKEYFFAGMKLTIPARTSNPATSYRSTTPNTVTAPTDYTSSPAPSYDSEKTKVSRSSDVNFEEKRFAGANFTCTSFDNFEDGSHYGFQTNCLNLENSLFGFTFGFGYNFGLVDVDYSTLEIVLGPNVSYPVNQYISLVLPVCGVCDYRSGKSKEEKALDKEVKKLTWGIMATPEVFVHLSDKFSINLGLTIGTSFVKDSKVTCGFIGGLNFAI